MQLTPHYGTHPLIVLDGPPSAIAEPTIRQRRRLATTVSAFTEEQWAHPSRCEGWSNRDVISHLDSTNAFWSFSIASGLRGEPTRFLASFDPVASPAQMVADASALSAGEVLARFAASTDALVDLLASLDDDGWSTLAEAPPGHIAVNAVTHHALWDSWVHERDICLPLGITPDEEPDEVLACLRYAAALSPAFAVTLGSGHSGTLAVEVTEPTASITIDISDRVDVRSDGTTTDHAAGTADLRLRGRGVDLVEALSIRAPLDQPVPAEAAWMFDGLARVFDVAG